MYRLNVTFNNIVKEICIDSTILDDNLVNLKKHLINSFDIKKGLNEVYFLINKTKLLTLENFKKESAKLNNLDISIHCKIHGGIIDVIIDVLVAFVKLFEGLAKIIVKFVFVIGHMFELLPVLFDPPRLIDDIMFSVSYGINAVLANTLGSMDPEAAPDQGENEESGPFGVNKRDKQVTCMPPTMVILAILIICPPFAILYKWGFLRGIIPAIVCGVMCVKLYYFPGLLFAVLMVLC